ncbi:AAA family ATPase [Pedobacter sp.]|nr:AAA family ATPase [Candidatus Saccharibacteria bacterium]
MDSLSLDPLSRQTLEDFSAQPKHALLLQGEKGTGTLTTAQVLASRLTSHAESILLIQPEKGTIPIDVVRSLYAATRSIRDDKMVVIIDDADCMGGDAQNALLKLLEEPPKHVYFILTTHSTQHLLDTVLSRAEHISLRLITRAESLALIVREGVSDTSEQAKLLFLASGKAAELHRLVKDPEYYQVCSSRMGDARQFIEQDRYGRLILLKKYMAERTEAEAFLLMIGQLLTYSLYRTVSESSMRTLEAINDALEALNRNGNVRAQLLRLYDRV